MVEKRQKKERVHLNLLILGRHAVGKTSLMNRHVKKKFNFGEGATTGINFLNCDYKSKDGTTVHYKIWDTAG